MHRYVPYISHVLDLLCIQNLKAHDDDDSEFDDAFAEKLDSYD